MITTAAVLALAFLASGTVVAMLARAVHIEGTGDGRAIDPLV